MLITLSGEEPNIEEPVPTWQVREATLEMSMFRCVLAALIVAVPVSLAGSCPTQSSEAAGRAAIQAVNPRNQRRHCRPGRAGIVESNFLYMALFCVAFW
jgi:hypothetical protein